MKQYLKKYQVAGKTFEELMMEGLRPQTAVQDNTYVTNPRVEEAKRDDAKGTTPAKKVQAATAKKKRIAEDKRQELLNAAANQGTIYSDTQSDLDKNIARAYYIASNPMSALGNYAKYGYVPQGNLGNYGQRFDQSPMEMIANGVNPFSWANAGYRFTNSLLNSESYDGLNASLDLIEAMPMLGMMKSALPAAQNAIQNTYRLLPEGTFKNYSKLSNADKSYRVAGMDAYDDFLENHIVRSVTPPPKPGMSFEERIMSQRSTAFPSFQKGYADLNYLPESGKGVVFETSLPTYKRGQINPVTGKPIKGRHYAHRVIDPNTGHTMTSIPAEDIRTFGVEPHWLKGYPLLTDGKTLASTSQLPEGITPAGISGFRNFRGIDIPIEDFKLGFPYVDSEGKTIPVKDLQDFLSRDKAISNLSWSQMTGTPIDETASSGFQNSRGIDIPIKDFRLGFPYRGHRGIDIPLQDLQSFLSSDEAISNAEWQRMVKNNTKKQGGQMNQSLKKYQGAGNVTPRLYDIAMEEYKFFQENPATWSEDPDMKNPDGSFNLCLDCIKVDWNDPEHIKDAYRLIEEGYSRGTHYNHDDFVKGYQALGLPEPVYNKAKMQSSSEVLPGKKSGGEMIRRADGSYSPRGFWDNIRDNVGSGKKPTKEMLATEEKLKKENGGSFDDDSKLRELFQRMFKKDDSNSEALNIDPENQDSEELQFLKDFARDPEAYYLSNRELARLSGTLDQYDAEARNKVIENLAAYRESQPKFRREDYPPPVVKKGKTLFGRPYQEVYTQLGPNRFGEVIPGTSKIRTVYYKNGNIAKQTIDGYTTFHDINGKVTAEGSANPFGHSGYQTYSNGYFDKENNVDYETAKRREEEISHVGSDNALGAFFQFLKMNAENLSSKGSQPGVSYTAEWGTFPDWSTFKKTENPKVKKASVKFKDGGIHIDPSKKGTFKAQATRMNMGVQEAASHILANKEDYSPEMVKKAVFAHNFANQYGGLVDEELIGYEMGGGVEALEKFFGGGLNFKDNPELSYGKLDNYYKADDKVNYKIEKNLLQNLEPTKFNRTAAGLSGLASPNSFAQYLPNEGLGSKLKGWMGLLGAAGSLGLAGSKLANLGNNTKVESNLYNEKTGESGSTKDILQQRYNAGNPSSTPKPFSLVNSANEIARSVQANGYQPSEGITNKSYNQFMPQNSFTPEPTFTEPSFGEGAPLKKQSMAAVNPSESQTQSNTSEVYNRGKYDPVTMLGDEYIIGSPETGYAKSANREIAESMWRSGKYNYQKQKNIPTSVQTPQMLQNIMNNVQIKRDGGLMKYFPGGPMNMPSFNTNPLQQTFQAQGINTGSIGNTITGGNYMDFNGVSPEQVYDGVNATVAPPAQQSQGVITPTTYNTTYMDPVGMRAANNFLTGLGMFNQSPIGERQNILNEQRNFRDSGNTDSMAPVNNPQNPFGVFTPNAGPGINNNLVSRPAVQDFGTKGNFAKYGGQKMYREGGSYMLTKDQILNILANGGEIEFM
jgi:hypothetical protein